jgi:DeoR family transcriptional regulator, glycerol-3-phosphate regulon repressor
LSVAVTTDSSRTQELSPRGREILAIARSQGRVSVEDLAVQFDVTPQTIRKDLNDLSEQQLVARVHGGAIINSGVENVAYEARRLIAYAEKRAIGDVAAQLIPNDCSLFINIGTTTEEVARALLGHQGLLVVTNNLNVATSLYRQPRVEVIVAGGPVRRADGGVIGDAAVDFIGQFKLDYAIIGASAIDSTGTLLDYDYREVRVSQAIIAHARHVILVADSTKFARTAPIKIAHISQVQTFVTDHLPPGPLSELCQKHEIRVVQTGSPDVKT